MPFSKAEQQADHDLKITSKALSIAFLLGWGALLLRVCLQGFTAHLGLPAFRAGAYADLALQTCSSFIWSLAWVTGGFLFGFIFGIPKVIAATTSTTNPALNDPSHNSSSKLKVNTNLEDISDWLTKVLVGATLTQIVKIPSTIKRAAEFMSSSDATKQPGFSAAVLVYYCALGFFAGYILTRLFFARAFALADQGSGLSTEAEKTLDDVNVSFPLMTSSNAGNPSIRKAALASNVIPITDSLSADQALRLAKGATFTGNTARALTASDLAIQKNPDDPEALLTYAWSLRKLGASIETVLPIVETAAQKLSKNSAPGVLTSVYASLAYLYLYQTPPSGYEGTLRALDQYKSKGGAPDADIEINRAAAYGQKYAYLKSIQTVTDVDPSDLANARQGALEAVQEALKLDPSSIGRLKELLWVTGKPDDDDLSVFQSDQDFTTLLPRTP